MATYVYVWGNNERRAAFKGRRCVVEARGALGTVLVRFVDSGERLTTSHRALRREPAARAAREEEAEASPSRLSRPASA